MPPDQRTVQLPTLRLCYFEWPGDPALPTILLTHANGFHARCWDGVVRHLGAHRVIAVDQRGHGRSDKTPPYAWASYGEDLAGFVSALGLRDVLGVGHSMGGHATLQAAMAVPEAFARLVLVDPVVLPPELYAAHGNDMKPEDHPVSRRRDRWRDWREMFERFEAREPFSLWDRDVLEAYCRWGVLPNPDGDDYVLACPPLVEAANYTQSTGKNIIDRLGEVSQPALVLRARQNSADRNPMDFTGSPTWPGLAQALPRGRDLFLPELTHFIPMQAPERTARWLLEEVTLIGA